MIMDGSILPIIAGVLVFFAVFGIIQAFIIEKYISNFSKFRNPATYSALVIAAGVGVLTVMKLAI